MFHWKPLLTSALAAAALSFGAVDSAARAQDRPFVGAIDDLPLMPGLEETPQRNMVFDTPSGRIVEAFATGRFSRESVIEFYDATLPQLGWARTGLAIFEREGEILELVFLGSGTGPLAGTLTVRFALSPAPPAPR